MATDISIARQSSNEDILGLFLKVSVEVTYILRLAFDHPTKGVLLRRSSGLLVKAGVAPRKREETPRGNARLSKAFRAIKRTLRVRGK